MIVLIIAAVVVAWSLGVSFAFAKWQENMWAGIWMYVLCLFIGSMFINH